MKDYFLQCMIDGKPGLYLCEVPTGFGKTYNAVHAMAEYARKVDQKRKIIYLTTLNKNLPEQELLKAFDGDWEEYDKHVLRIRANFDEVVEKIPDLNIPVAFHTESYNKLRDLIYKYNRAMHAKVTDMEYIQDLTERIQKAEQAFRKHIAHKLHEEFPNKTEKKKAIRTRKEWRWLGELYPAVFTDEHDILLMSVSKFMKRNSPVIEPSYEFLKSDMIKNAVIFIDEFDATKATIKSEIIERSIALNEEYIGLFKQIIAGMNPDYYSADMRRAYELLENRFGFKWTFSRIAAEGLEIVEKNYVNLSYKMAEEFMDRRQNFLFKDLTYHTAFHNTRDFIQAQLNQKENRVDIILQNGEEYKKARIENQDMISLYQMLRDINRFLIHFRILLYQWARNYADTVNQKRDPYDDEMTHENAMSSILSRINLSKKQIEILLSEICAPSQSKLEKRKLRDQSFYQNGMEIFELEDSDQHYDSTDLRWVQVRDTPEKILLYLSERATVVGISATAEVRSVICNYDLEYLKRRLEGTFHRTPLKIKNSIKEQILKNLVPYKENRIKVHNIIMEDMPAEVSEEDFLAYALQDEELAQALLRRICRVTDSPYYVKRYMNLAIAFSHFIQLDSIQSFLYLGMALPKSNDERFYEPLISEMFDTIRSRYYDGNDFCDLFFLRSHNFDEEKEKLLERLSDGEKIFIMSTYQTIGAGQNLQYIAPYKEKLVSIRPDFEEDEEREVYKDIDAIYLGDITHLTVNINGNSRIKFNELMELLFQIEELKENTEISIADTETMIRLAFQAHTDTGFKARNLISGTRSVMLQATRTVMQAVGRMCRTYYKNPEQFIFIDKSLLEKISVEELNKHSLPIEMYQLKQLREEMGKDTLPEESVVLKAEKVSYDGMHAIRQLLSRNWTSESMKLWEELRTTVLTHPTADASLIKENEFVRDLYITSGKDQNRYLYSQNSDFRDVTIEFLMEKRDFRNSLRARKRAEKGIVPVYEMTAENSGLPSVLLYPGMSEYFEREGFAKEYRKAEYMMSPVLYHNIYKGALGEVAGSFILKQELGIKLKSITDPEKFEFFDFELAQDVYIDFKNWKFTYLRDREAVKKEIIRKMDAIGAKRVYVIALFGDSDKYEPSTQIDQRIIEVPGLIDKDGNVIYKNLHMIKEEDF